MTVIASVHSPARAADPGPCLTATPGADRIIAVLFGVTIVLFLLGLFALATAL